MCVHRTYEATNFRHELYHPGRFRWWCRAPFQGAANVLRDQIDATGAVVGKVSAIGGGVSAFVFGLSASEFAAIVGVLVGVLGWLTQVFFNWRKDRRDRLESEARERREQAKFEREMSRYGGTD